MTGGSGPVVRIFPDMQALSRAAADLFLSLSRKAVSARGRFAAALSGGTTPRTLYALLAGKPYCDQVEWERIHLFWADERCVPRGHPDSNFGLVHELLLSRIAIPEENVHRIKGEDGAARAAEVYERDLRTFFGRDGVPAMDLVILGMGEDGHTASLFPGPLQAQEHDRLTLPVFLSTKNKDRVTLTLPVLNQAKDILFLVTGLSKREMIRKILAAGNPDGAPAGLVHPATGDSTWYLDRDAASLLPQR